MGRGGDVFVLDMGEPVRITDLAAHMVRLSGLEVMSQDMPEGDIEIVFTGLRPGEKLYEELLIGDDVTATDHPRIMTANEDYWAWPRLEAYLRRLHEASSRLQHELIRELLMEAPTAYHPQGPIADLVWLEQDATPVSPAAVMPLSEPEAQPEPEAQARTEPTGFIQPAVSSAKW